jgi:hypothetical protein
MAVQIQNVKPRVNKPFAALNDGYRTVFNGGHFQVTEEVWRKNSSGDMYCLVTGESCSQKEFRNRCKKTTLVITTKPKGWHSLQELLHEMHKQYRRSTS